MIRHTDDDVKDVPGKLITLKLKPTTSYVSTQKVPTLKLFYGPYTQLVTLDLAAELNIFKLLCC